MESARRPATEPAQQSVAIANTRTDRLRSAPGIKWPPGSEKRNADAGRVGFPVLARGGARTRPEWRAEETASGRDRYVTQGIFPASPFQFVEHRFAAGSAMFVQHL
jgi:hypothetical protein